MSSSTECSDSSPCGAVDFRAENIVLPKLAEGELPEKFMGNWVLTELLDLISSGRNPSILCEDYPGINARYMCLKEYVKPSSGVALSFEVSAHRENSA